MPQLLRRYVKSVAMGFTLASCFISLLILLDLGHVRHLIVQTACVYGAVVMLVIFRTIRSTGCRRQPALIRAESAA